MMIDSSYELLKTKLTPQISHQSLVKRPRLISKLLPDQYIPKLAIVIAPAGYGKSTFLLELKQYLEIKNLVAWLSLSRNDNSPDEISAHLVQAYHFSVFGKLLAPDEFERSWEQIAPRTRIANLLQDIAKNKTPVILMLDDFHLIENPKVLELIDWALENAPPNLSLMISSRTHINIRSVPILRAQNNIAEIYSDDLSFNVNECETFLSSTMYEPLEADSIKVLQHKTEGWIAAIQLARLALHTEADKKAFVEAFTGTDRDVVEYLGHCVISQLSEQQRRFIADISVLNEFCPELCDYLSQTTDSIQCIHLMEERGLFIFSIDRQRKWFRFHHLFQDFLISRLKLEQPERYKKLCCSAALWFQNNNLPEKAIEYYLCGESYESALALLAENVLTIVQNKGNHDRLMKWMAVLPTEYISLYPSVGIGYAWSLTFTRHFEKSMSIIAALRQNISNTSLENFPDDFVNYSCDMLEAMNDIMAGDFTYARIKSQRWLEIWTNAPSREQGTVRGILGAACFDTCEFELGRKTLTEAKYLLSSSGADYGVAWMDTLYARLCVRQARLTEAEANLAQSLKETTKRLGQQTYAAALLSLALGEIHYHKNRLDTASILIDDAFAFIADHGLADTTANGFILKSRIVGRNDANAALTLLKEGELLGRKLGIGLIQKQIVLEQIRLLLSLGRLQDAKYLWKEHDFDSITTNDDTVFSPRRAAMGCIKSRLDLANNKADSAIKRLNNLNLLLEENNCTAMQIELKIVLARCYWEKGAENDSIKSIKRAMLLASEEGCISPFIEEINVIEALLYNVKKIALNLPQEKRYEDFVDNIFSACGIEEKTEGNASLTLTEPLSKRETEVIQLLESGLTNQQLADKLFVSLPTIKWHLSKVYEKLHAHSRLEAVARARKVGILSDDPRIQ